MTRVVNVGKAPYDVYIGRPSVWGNPFPLRVEADRARPIARYVEWVVRQPLLLARLDELRGRTLGCYCKPKACHGDALVLLAYGVPPDCLDLFI